MRHELKTLSKYFKSTWAGRKTFEIRFNDRNFELDDEIVLLEWDNNQPTGRSIYGFITYLTDFEQKIGYVVFSFHEAGREEA